MIQYNSALKIFSSTLINNGSFFSGFSTSPLGDSRNLGVIENFFKQNNININKLIILNQIHSINIEKFSNNLSTEKVQIVEDTDGLVTSNPNTALAVRTADCIPLIITDRSKGIIGISHQGWRGTLKNMSEKMINSFFDLKSKVSDLSCAIGPGIGVCCYEIDNELSYEFKSDFEEYSEQIIFYKRGKPHLSLNRLNYLQLIKVGVKKENIDFFPFCTKCDSERFFSRRRSASNNFGEMFSFIIKKI